MEIFCHIQMQESGKAKAYCTNCVITILGSETVWLIKRGKYFCCWECIEEYEITQRSH